MFSIFFLSCFVFGWRFLSSDIWMTNVWSWVDLMNEIFYLNEVWSLFFNFIFKNSCISMWSRMIQPITDQTLSEVARRSESGSQNCEDMCDIKIFSERLTRVISRVYDMISGITRCIKKRRTNKALTKFRLSLYTK